MANPQKEHGYTAIANEIIEALLRADLNGTEWNVTMYLLRKTYGYQKKQDEISLSQFLKVIPSSKPTICKALKILQLVKIVKLVKKGNSKISSNCYTFDKNYDNWQLVKKSKLVKFKKPTSKENEIQLVKKPLHTKETIQKKTKERPSLPLLKDYFLEKKESVVEAEKFYNHFQSNGWKVGGKAPMKDWKAAVNSWILRNKGEKGEKEWKAP